MNTQKEKSQSKIQKNGYSSNDKNLTFITILASQYEQENFKNNKKFSEILETIKRQLLSLDESQRLQWAHILELKCGILQKKTKTNEARSNIRKLVILSNLIKIPYDTELIQKIIKPLYFQLYGERVVPFFKKAGYKTDQFQFVSYSEPWYSSFIRFFSFD